MIDGTAASLLALLFRTEREAQKMPLFLYFPLIIWMGLMGVAQDEMRVPVKIKAQGPLRR